MTRKWHFFFFQIARETWTWDIFKINGLYLHYYTIVCTATLVGIGIDHCASVINARVVEPGKEESESPREEKG